jgi:flagellar biogenesis protein FliO
MRVGVAILGLMLCCAPALLAQSTRPAVAIDDPSQDAPIPPRRGAPATQSAGGTTIPGNSGDVFDFKKLGLALGVVIAAILLSQRVWKRLGIPGVGGRSSGALQVVSRLNVSPKQQILLIRVGRRLVLVGNSGAQMNPLCEIADPEEAAGLLGQAAVEREGSVTSSFGAVLGGEEKRFEEESGIATSAKTDEVDLPPEEDPSLATTREELNGLMDKVRGLSKQFRQA